MLVGPLLLGGCLALLLYGVHRFCAPFLGNPRLPRYALLVCLLGACTTILFLLPPFQGPDEIVHWKFALAYYRREGLRDPAYMLPEQLGSYDLPFQRNRRQNASYLRQPPPAKFEPQQPANYVYVRWFSYPLLAALAFIYPRTATMAEALHFYYLCRVVPAVVLLLLLFWASRRYRVPYTALVFFSLPVFLQQCCVVTTDVFLNLGAIAATLLFLHLWRKEPGENKSCEDAQCRTSRARNASAAYPEEIRLASVTKPCEVRHKQIRVSYFCPAPDPSLPLTALLWALCVLMTCSKFIVGGVLLFPLLLLPYRRIPHKRIVIPVAVLAVVSILVLLLPRFLNSLRAASGFYGPEQLEAQIATLGTWGGVCTFLRMYWGLLKTLCHVGTWASCMGWLDTPLSPQHLVLIRVSFVVAVLLDLWQFGPQLRRVWNERRGEAALVAGVIAANLFVNTFSVALVYFALGVRPGGAEIGHWQVRHFFPAAAVLVLLPMLLWPCGSQRRSEPISGGLDSPLDSGTLPAACGAVALGVLPLLFFSRNVELAVDLLTRYW